MFKHILKKVGRIILVLLFISFLLYLVLRCVPLDFIEAKILSLNTSGTMTQETIQNVYDHYGLDANMIVGYFKWIFNICRFDFSGSFLNVISGK